MVYLFKNHGHTNLCKALPFVSASRKALTPLKVGGCWDLRRAAPYDVHDQSYPDVPVGLKMNSYTTGSCHKVCVDSGCGAIVGEEIHASLLKSGLGSKMAESCGH
ncbi:NADH dehydrogenase ubiquinone iron-sulfur protein 2 [Nymphaea thermarum]|nr:NADH dehydrogenase ubiquinone iron-sulfur protein 2 [Nymphaea thermarum]